MAVVRRSPLDPYPVTPNYLATRNSALHIPPAQFSNMKFKSDEVYGIIIDIPMGQTIMVTMVCFINGAANLYFNNGSEYTGASTKYKSVVQAARNLVVNSNPLKQTCKRTSQFPLPVAGKHHIYMLTKRGTFKAEINPQTIHTDSKEKRVVYHLYQQVMGALRIAQLRDAENLPESGNQA
ncbi:MAG: hypothetical protein K2G88_03780 [Oscillospiraceae bacterium]|nr:hypothetical protein [Oscillospiraceae bacterium]MDE6657273.1 hypothetical protein [Oscillospiraceae bacterium]